MLCKHHGRNPSVVSRGEDRFADIVCQRIACNSTHELIVPKDWALPDYFVELSGELVGGNELFKPTGGL
jgi:hypothetical protein